MSAAGRTGDSDPDRSVANDPIGIGRWSINEYRVWMESVYQFGDASPFFDETADAYLC